MRTLGELIPQKTYKLAQDTCEHSGKSRCKNQDDWLEEYLQCQIDHV